MDLNNIWNKNKGKIIGALITLLLTVGGSIGTYILTSVNYYESAQKKAEIVSIIDSLMIRPETLKKILSDPNIKAAQEKRDEALSKNILKEAVASTPPDSLKFSTKLSVAMDIRKESLAREINKMYLFYKALVEERKYKQGKSKKIKL